MMKCYVAGSSCPQEWPHVEACFANSHKEAKGFMWKNSGRLSDECDGDYMDLRVWRHKEHDGLFDQSKTEPYLVADDKTLRLMGWEMEGDRRCDSCGLASMDIEEFEVCDTCMQCAVCGFSGDCNDH